MAEADLLVKMRDFFTNLTKKPKPVKKADLEENMGKLGSYYQKVSKL